MTEINPKLRSITLQLCTRCWCATVFLLDAAAFCAAAMVCVAAAAACLAANCNKWKSLWLMEERGAD